MKLTRFVSYRGGGGLFPLLPYGPFGSEEGTSNKVIIRWLALVYVVHAFGIRLKSSPLLFLKGLNGMLGMATHQPLA